MSVDPQQTAHLRAVRLLQLEQFAIDVRERLRSAADLATNGLRSLMLVNGGAIVGLFALLGQGAGSPFVKAINNSAILLAFALFALGVVFCLAANILGYYSQQIIAMYEQDISYQLYEVENGNPRREVGDEQRLRASRMLDWAVICAILSTLGFLSGATSAILAATYAI